MASQQCIEIRIFRLQNDYTVKDNVIFLNYNEKGKPSLTTDLDRNNDIDEQLFTYAIYTLDSKWNNLYDGAFTQEDITMNNIKNIKFNKNINEIHIDMKLIQ